MIDSSQVPPDSNCQFGPKANGFRLQQPGFHCDVRYNKQSIVDDESKLLGLDKLITKQEPPANMIPKPTSNEALDSIKKYQRFKFSSI